MKHILLAGATGLVGKQVAEELAVQDGVEVHAVMRHPSDALPHSIRQHVAPIAEWPAIIAEIKPNTAISCLGTTIRTAGSQAAFRAVDFDLSVAVAQSSRQAGAQQIIAVSSVGASARSNNFYLKTKGEAEDALRSMDFERVDIIRPGLLTGGSRPDSRPGEAIGIALSPLTDLLMLGPLDKYRSTPSAKVAQAIVTLALGGGYGKFIHENEAIRILAG
jgi:uncharacterized protein YbjT (DUF2867 family)